MRFLRPSGADHWGCGMIRGFPLVTPGYFPGAPSGLGAPDVAMADDSSYEFAGAGTLDFRTLELRSTLRFVQGKVHFDLFSMI